jgi:hypothetical protein
MQRGTILASGGCSAIDQPRVVKVVDDPHAVAVYMLGRLISSYIIIKTDRTGDRIVPMVPEVNKLERNCIDA